MRPIITFLTDFGLDGAAGTCRGVMVSIAPESQIVDISHVIRKYAIRDGAYVLRSALPWLPVGVHVAVVDPGVGTSRRPIGLRVARGDILIGPDNGLLRPAADRLGGIVDARLLENPDWLLPMTSRTFHGRDIFAPVAAHLAGGARFEDVGRGVSIDSLVDLTFPEANVMPGTLETAVVYIDSFGNLRLAGGTTELAGALGEVRVGDSLELAIVTDLGERVERLRWCSTFGDVGAGELLAYEDSTGNLALAVSGGDAARRLGLGPDARIRLRRI